MYYLGEFNFGKKRKNQEDKETLTEEELFGYYFIAGYTSGGAPYGITMAEAEKQGLLDEKQPNNDDENSEFDLPF